MGKSENFTAERIANYRFHPSISGKSNQSVYMDGKTPGLGLRVTVSGAKSYFFETRLHGKTLRITIGDVRTWSIANAQAEARRLKSLTDQGHDPRAIAAENKAKIEASLAEQRRQKLTVREAWNVYVAEQKPRWSERHYEDHIRLCASGGDSKKRGTGKTVAGPLAPLMGGALTELTSARIAMWLESETTTRPTSAAQSYRLLRAFIRWTVDRPEYRGILGTDSYTARIVRDALPKNRAKDGDCLQREQLVSWFSAVSGLSNQVICAYLQALLLTGARREELAGLRWVDVDFQWKTLTIRDKIEGTRTIPLTPHVAQLLKELQSKNETPPDEEKVAALIAAGHPWRPSPWVFSSPTSADGKLAEPRLAHNRALKSANLPHVTLHGLRRSFGTLAEWVDCPSGVSAQIMGHKPSALAEKHYRRRPIDLLRKWHEKIEAWILEQAQIESDHPEPN